METSTQTQTDTSPSNLLKHTLAIGDAQRLYCHLPQAFAAFACLSWQNRDNNAEVIECSLEWEGNTVPGSNFSYPEELGKLMNKLNGMKTIMHFFQRYQKQGFQYFPGMTK